MTDGTGLNLHRDVCREGPSTREAAHWGVLTPTGPGVSEAARAPSLLQGPAAQGEAELSPRVPESKVMPSLEVAWEGDKPLEVQKLKCQRCHQRSVTLGEPLNTLGF